LLESATTTLTFKFGQVNARAHSCESSQHTEFQKLQSGLVRFCSLTNELERFS